MSEEGMQQFTETVERLAGAAEALERMLGRIEAQQQELSAKVAMIVAAVEERPEPAGETDTQQLATRVAELEKANADLKAQAARAARKTLPPMVSALLSKYAGEGGERVETAVLDKALSVLSVDQRIAVKAEMARAGILD